MHAYMHTCNTYACVHVCVWVCVCVCVCVCVRVCRLGVLEERMAALGVNAAPLDWYLDLRRFGGVPHAGPSFFLVSVRFCVLCIHTKSFGIELDRAVALCVLLYSCKSLV